MNIKIRLTEDEENMILSVEEAERQGIERNHIAMTRALSKIIEENRDLDANSFNILKKEYRFLDGHDGKMRVFICSPKCIDIVYKMRLEFHCSEEMVVRAILYHHNKKKTVNKDDYFAVG